MERATRIALLHRQRLMRDLLVRSLDHQADWVVSVAAPSFREMGALREDALPHLFVIDLGLPAASGLDDAREISQRHPQTPILMIGATESEGDVLACCEAGATSYATLDAPLEEFVRQVRSAARGEAACSPRVAALLFARVRERAREARQLARLPPNHLTRREVEIVSLIEAGLSNKEIARHLELQVQTVKNHVHNILDKLKVDRRLAAAKWARQRGLLPSREVGPAHATAPPAASRSQHVEIRASVNGLKQPGAARRAEDGGSVY